MPILLRFIAQRLFIIALSSVTVLGLAPQTNLNKEEDKPSSESNIPSEIKVVFSEIHIPLPKINILNIPKANLTKPDSSKTSLPIIPKEQIKTSLVKITEKNQTEIPTKEIKVTTTPVQPSQQANNEVTTVIIPPTLVTPDESTLASIENVLVNIICIRQIGNKISLTNGSGVIISSKGVVITNAHVAQLFLLKDAGYNCTIRRENIPLYGFNAIPLYISESWIKNNYRDIANPSPTGTGKYDYALLKITTNTNPTLSVPIFSVLPFDTTSNFLDSGDTITIAGYPGKITPSLEIAKNAELKTDRVRVREIYTLDQNTVDVVSTGDTPVAQRGTSGGGAFKDNKLGGIIVSTKNGSSDGQFVVNIINLSYINREIKNETGKTLSNFISGDLQKFAEDFATGAPHLTELLMRNI